MAWGKYWLTQSTPRTNSNGKTTRTITYLYFLKSFVMPQHDLKYFASTLEEMLEQSSSRMLTWATRWKFGIYQSIWQIKLISKQMTVHIWKMWDPVWPNKPTKKIDRRQITKSKQKKYKDTKITAKLKVTKRPRSTSKVPQYIARMYRKQESVKDFAM